MMAYERGNDLKCMTDRSRSIRYFFSSVALSTLTDNAVAIIYSSKYGADLRFNRQRAVENQ